MPWRVERSDVVPEGLYANLPQFSGPPSLGVPAQTHFIAQYNPSIVVAPKGLCSRCQYMASLRADAMHQCDASSPLFTYKRASHANAWFRGVVLLLLDAEFNTLKWTWFLNNPRGQITENANQIKNRWKVSHNSSDDFHPPWAFGVYDARLFSIDDAIFVTYNCMSCHFSISQIKLDVEEDAAGGILHFAARSMKRKTFDPKVTKGRNQALFLSGGGRLMLQSWYDIIKPLGTLTFSKTRLSRPHHYKDGDASMFVLSRTMARRVRTRRFSSEFLRSYPDKYPSLTCHLAEWDGMFWGIGHLHDAATHSTRFGTNYRHFFYALNATPPHDIVFRTRELFCIGKCDTTIQYVSGLLIRNNTAYLAYGLQDCNASILRLSMREVMARVIRI